MACVPPLTIQRWYKDRQIVLFLESELAGKPIPPDCILHQKTSLGAVSGQKRWRCDRTSRLFTWDALHGEIEVFNRRGKHLGVMDPNGNFIKTAVKGRIIDV